MLPDGLAYFVAVAFGLFDLALEAFERLKSPNTGVPSGDVQRRPKVLAGHLPITGRRDLRLVGGRCCGHRMVNRTGGIGWLCRGHVGVRMHLAKIFPLELRSSTTPSRFLCGFAELGHDPGSWLTGFQMSRP